MTEKWFKQILNFQFYPLLKMSSVPFLKGQSRIFFNLFSRVFSYLEEVSVNSLHFEKFKCNNKKQQGGNQCNFSGSL